MKKLKFVFFSLLLLSFLGCNDSESNTGASDPTLSIRLADMPGEFDEVNIEIVDVMMKYNDSSDDESGWQSLNPINTGIYNLLDLAGGINVLLVDKFQIPAGTLNQIRLVLGDNNTVVMNGETFPLKTPSAQQSGLKLKVNAVLEEGFTYNFLLDFDVDKSVVVAGNSGNINLKPVIRVSTEVTSGIIEGTVEPGDVSTMAYVVVDDKGTETTDDDEIISAYTDENGHFALWGVPAGTYDVVLVPDAESVYDETTVGGVVVTYGEITTISDPIQLNQKPGSISGKVTGLDVGVVATASVMVNGNAVSDDTDDSGQFLIEDVPAGTYTVTFSAEGYVSQDVENVVVEANAETMMPDVQLVKQ